MEILVAISRIMELKIVQWLMLSIIALLLVAYLFLSLKHNSLKLESSLRETELLKLSEATTIQNVKIQEMTLKFEQQQKTMKESIAQASKIALESQKNMKAILSYEFSDNCSSSLKEAVELVQTK